MPTTPDAAIPMPKSTTVPPKIGTNVAVEFCNSIVTASLISMSMLLLLPQILQEAANHAWQIVKKAVLIG